MFLSVFFAKNKEKVVLVSKNGRSLCNAHNCLCCGKSHPLFTGKRGLWRLCVWKRSLQRYLNVIRKAFTTAKASKAGAPPPVTPNLCAVKLKRQKLLLSIGIRKVNEPLHVAYIEYYRKNYESKKKRKNCKGHVFHHSTLARIFCSCKSTVISEKNSLKYTLGNGID